MSSYLSASELAELVGCKPNSYSCMRRWLDRNTWPYAISIRGFPMVARSYHADRMHGRIVQTEDSAQFEPDFGVLAS